MKWEGEKLAINTQARGSQSPLEVCASSVVAMRSYPPAQCSGLAHFLWSRLSRSPLLQPN